MAKLALSVVAAIMALPLAACTHEQPPPAAPVTEPPAATESAPADTASPETRGEKQSNDASGSSSPMPDR